MTDTNLDFIGFLSSYLTNTLEVDNTESVAKNLSVSHYDVSEKEGGRMYSSKEVWADCKNAPEKLYLAPAAISVPKKLSNTLISNNVFC